MVVKYNHCDGEMQEAESRRQAAGMRDEMLYFHRRGIKRLKKESCLPKTPLGIYTKSLCLK